MEINSGVANNNSGVDNEDDRGVDPGEESPLTPTSEIPLISNDWYSSDDLLGDETTSQEANTTNYSPTSNPESSKRRDMYADTESTHGTSNMGDSTYYSPTSNPESSQQAGSYTGTANTQWTSNIDAQSSIYIGDTNDGSTSDEQADNADGGSQQDTLRLSKVIDSMKLRLSIDDSYTPMRGQRQAQYVDRKSNSVYTDDIEESGRVGTPHPHYKLFQKRLNNLVFNIDHLSLIYRYRLCKR